MRREGQIGIGPNQPSLKQQLKRQIEAAEESEI
jgi:hypothetical protein